MGVSRAAASLRQMVGEQVLLSVPSVKIVTRQAASKLVERGNTKKLVGVQQSFEGPFAGKAILIFPEAQSLELVRSIVGNEHSLEDVIDLEQEALAETGNIILNGCLATIANVLHRTMRMSLPSIVRGDGATLVRGRWAGFRWEFVLFLYIDFNIKNRDIHGFIALLMDLPSINALKEFVSDFIKRDREVTFRSCGITYPIFCLVSVFDTVDIGLVVIDGDGQVVAWNAGWRAFRGDQQRKFLVKTLFEIFPDARNTRCLASSPMRFRPEAQAS